MTNSSENQEDTIARLQRALEEKERQLAREVTRRRRTEAGLRRAGEALEERINAALDSLPGLFYLFDEEGRFLRWSKSFETVSGYSASEIADMHPLDFFTGQDRSLIAARIQEVFETGSTTAEAEFVAKDGRKTPYLFTGRRTSVNNVPCMVGMAVDLSEQKRIEKELQQLAERLQLMLNNLTIVAYEIDADGTFLLSRGKGLEKLDLQPDQVVGTSVFDLYREFPTIIVAARRALAGVAQQFEVEVAGAVWDSNFIPIVNERGEVERVFGTGVDVTERKRAEQALQQEKAFTEAIVDSLPGVFFLFNEEGRFLRWNQNAERVLGYSPAEISMLQPTDVVAAADHALLAEKIRVAFTEGETGLEANVRTKDGRIIPYLFTGRRILVEEGPLIVGIGVDISDRRQAEEKSQRSQAQLQHVIDTVPDGVLLLDADGQVILANPVAKEYLRLLVPEQNDSRLTHLGGHPLTELLTSPPKGLWHEINANDRHFELIARPVENSSNNTGWVLVVRDVTQRREIQKRVQEQERLSAVGQLAAGIAHDFNNVLAAIVLYVQIMQRTAELPPAIRKHLQMIEQQAHRAADLTRQILDFSRQSLLARQPLDLVPFLQDLTELFRRTLPENVSVELNYDPADYLIYADPSRMQQVVMNLAVNARDAMPQGGRLQFGLARLSLAGDNTPPVPEMASGDWVILRVADSGTGIPSQVLQHIFEPFFTTKAVGKGVGLGLAQVYGIVQQHDGYLDVETEVGRGTTFLLYFPALTTGEMETAEPDPTTLSQGQGQTILVVEDDAAIRQALAQSLQLIGYRVIAAENGREALAVLDTSADQIDLVLSDVVMPEMGGAALFHAMQQRRLTIPLLLLTGHPMNKEMERLMAQGLAGWAPKPTGLADLANLLAQVLAR
jgi:two-component system, cell cycle sensor histidine kinase and response regulator CckA